MMIRIKNRNKVSKTFWHKLSVFNFSYLRATVTIWNYFKIIAMQLSLNMHKSAMENFKKIKNN